MRTGLYAAVIVLAAGLADTAAVTQQSRGAVTSVTIEKAEGAASYLFIIHGKNPCNSVRLNAGEGPVTYPIFGLPTTLAHTYKRTGLFNVRVEGLGNCDGAAVTTVTVASPTPAPAPTDWTEARFNSIDRNKDNIISPNEWRFGTEEFARVDRNRDNVIVLREFLRGADAPTPTGTPAAPTRTIPPGAIVVSAKMAWTDSGVNVRAGDRINIRSEGVIQWGPDASATAGPGGVGSRSATPKAPVPTALHGALVARVGNGEPFLIGTRPDAIYAPNGGRLYLGINDDVLSDNAGEFFVWISVGRGGR